MKLFGSCRSMMVYALLTPLFASWSGGARADDADAIVQSAVQAASQWKAYTCKMRVEVSGPDLSMESFGAMSYLKPAYLRMDSSVKIPGRGTLETHMVSDGRVAFTETKIGEIEDAVIIKSSIPAARGVKDLAGGAQAAPSQMLAQFRKMYDFQIDENSSRERLDGQVMDVLIGHYREGSLERIMREDAETRPSSQKIDTRLATELFDAMMSTIRIWIGREDRFLHRIELNPKDVQARGVVNTDSPPESPTPPPVARIVTTFYDITLNPALSPADFAYVPPAGRTVIDLTTEASAAAGSNFP